MTTMTPLPKAVRNAMVEENMGLAYFYARKFQASHMEYEDLVQEGMIGLMDAAERFDPDRGVKFATYAMWHIRKTIMEAIRSRNDIVRTPRRHELKSCVTLENAEQMVDSEPAASDLLEAEEEHDAIHHCIRRLPAREAIVIRLRHGINTEKLTLKKVGHILGVSPERVRQIQNDAEENLRQIMLDCATLGDHGAITAEHRKESAQQPENE